MRGIHLDTNDFCFAPCRNSDKKSFGSLCLPLNTACRWVWKATNHHGRAGRIDTSEIAAWSAAGPRLKDASQNCEKHSPVIYELTERHSNPRAAREMTHDCAPRCQHREIPPEHGAHRVPERQSIPTLSQSRQELIRLRVSPSQYSVSMDLESNLSSWPSWAHRDHRDSPPHKRRAEPQSCFP